MGWIDANAIRIELFLAFMITAAVVWQAFLTRRIARIDAKQEARRQEPPQLRFRGIGPLKFHPDDRLHSGYFVTNSGQRDVVISEMSLDVAVDSENPEDSIVVPSKQRRLQVPASLSDLPKRLSFGDQAEVFFDVDKLRELGRVRFMCMDSLGNKHYSDDWLEYAEDGLATVYGDPGQGRISVRERG